MNARKLKESTISTYSNLQKSYKKTTSQTESNPVSLRLVPAYEKPLRKWGVTLIAIPVLLLGGIIGGIAMSTAIAENQYEIVKLTQQERALKQENESLSSSVAYYNSPQVLNNKAQKLGLVTAGTHSVVDLSTGKVEDAGTEAVMNTKHDYQDNIPLPKKPKIVTADSKLNSRKEATAPMDSQTVKEVTQKEVQEKPKPTVIKVAPKPTKVTVIGVDGARPSDWDNSRLNGGTIPAPNLKPTQ